MKPARPPIFKPRLTVRALMVLVAVFGLVLAGGVLGARCYRTRIHSLKRIDELESEIGILRKILGNHPVGIEPLKYLEMQLQEFKHVARHPWHTVPFGEDPYNTSMRVIYGSEFQDASK
jgi:hypothetical protein